VLFWSKVCCSVLLSSSIYHYNTLQHICNRWACFDACFFGVAIFLPHIVHDLIDKVVCCSVLQCVAVYCSVLQGVVVSCNVLQCVAHTAYELIDTVVEILKSHLTY